MSLVLVTTYCCDVAMVSQKLVMLRFQSVSDKIENLVGRLALPCHFHDTQICSYKSGLTTFCFHNNKIALSYVAVKADFNVFLLSIVFADIQI